MKTGVRRGRPRGNGEPIVIVGFGLPESLRVAAAAFAISRGQSLSAVLREALIEFLRRRKPSEPRQ